MTLGNEEKGSAIAADTAKADPITTTSGMLRKTPNLAMAGIRMMDATVWETKVAIVPQKIKMYNKASQGLVSGRDELIPAVKYASRPEDSTAFPRTFPPPTRMRVCQERELKSTSESIPDPNINDTKHNEIMAMSPNMSMVKDEVAKRRIVRRDIIITVMFLLPMTLFLS